jgi:hypothetical protein
MNESDKVGYKNLRDLQNPVVSYKDQKLLLALYRGETFRRPDKFNRLIRLGLIYLKDDLSADFTAKGEVVLQLHLSKKVKNKNAAESISNREPRGIEGTNTD